MYFHLPYRQTEGIAQGHAHQGKVPSIPDYTTINRRINRLNIKIKDNNNKYFEDDYIIIAINSTGIMVTNRGQWMKRQMESKKERIFENPYIDKRQEQENTISEYK